MSKAPICYPCNSKSKLVQFTTFSFYQCLKCNKEVQDYSFTHESEMHGVAVFKLGDTYVSTTCCTHPSYLVKAIYSKLYCGLCCEDLSSVF